MIYQLDWYNDKNVVTTSHKIATKDCKVVAISASTLVLNGFMHKDIYNVIEWVRGKRIRMTCISSGCHFEEKSYARRND